MTNIIRTREDLKILVNQYVNRSNSDDIWIFRGQSSDWPLLSSFDRTANDIVEDNPGLQINRPKLEQDMILRFVRHCKAYLDRPVDLDSWLEVLTLMQHSGAPTRFMEWTYSPFIALFYSYSQKAHCLPEIRRAVHPGGLDPEGHRPCHVLYACNISKLNREILEKLKYKCDADSIELHRLLGALIRLDRYEKCQSAFRELAYRNYKIPYIFGINPFFIDERLSVQQGIFLFQGNVNITFDRNLSYMSPVVRKYMLSRRLRSYMLDLLDHMNINTTSMYPGLEGFARSFQNLHSLYNHS